MSITANPGHRYTRPDGSTSAFVRVVALVPGEGWRIVGCYYDLDDAIRRARSVGCPAFVA